MYRQLKSPLVFLLLILLFPSANFLAQPQDSIDAYHIDSAYYAQEKYLMEQKIEQQKRKLMRQQEREVRRLESRMNTRRSMVILIVAAVIIFLAGIVFLIVWLAKK